MNHNNKMLKLTKGHGQICNHVRNKHFRYKSPRDDRILKTLSHMDNICEMLKLTKGQGNKVKDQGQIYI